jgi:DNA-directed RNA polymerase specialized sigma24 family protein
LARISEDAAKRTEDQQLLDLGLSRLPPEQRLVFTLAYCMDYSCEEIAAIVECPVNTVKSRMWQARRKLRTIICAAAAPQGIVVGGDGGAQPEDLALLQRDR